MNKELTKFQRFDSEIIEKRKKFFASTSISPQFAVDNWGLIAGQVPIANQLAKYEILKKTISVPGHICEFGVYNGANLLFMAKVMNVLAPNDFKRIYGFDSFKGLTEFSEKEIEIKKNDLGSYLGNKKLLEEMITIHQLEGTVELVDGLIEETLSKFIRKNMHHLYSLIYIDTDLYLSTKHILDLLWEKLSIGGIIAFDEGYHDRFPGEGIAAQEFLLTIKGQFEMHSFPFARQPMFYIVKK